MSVEIEFLVVLVQGAPAPSGAAHVPLLQVSVATHGLLTGSHEVPAAPGEAHMPSLLHTVPTAQSVSALHDAPGVGTSAQAPHVLPVAMWQ